MSTVHGEATSARGVVSPVDAAMEGFRLIRRESRVLLVWGLVALVFNLVNGAVMAVLARPALTALSATPRPQGAAALALYAQAFPAYLAIFILGVAVSAVLNAAVNRAVLRPEAPSRRFGYLQLGADEMRQLATLVLMGLVLFGAYLLLLTAAILLVVVPSLVVGAGRGGAASPLLIGVRLIVGLAVICNLVVPMVRLSLAPALTFDTGRVRVFHSWELTRGSFWRLLGAYALAWIFALILGLAILFVSEMAALAMGGFAGVSQLMRPDMASPAGYFAPARLVSLVLGSGGSALFWVLTIGAPARAYVELKRPAARPVRLDTFGSAP